jgi:GAF domain-containing protein
MLASPLYQQIVDNAQAATGARLVHFAWLDAEDGQVHVGAMSGLHTAVLKRGLAAVSRFAPDFDALKLRFRVDINPWNEVVYKEGRPVAVRLEEIAAGACPPAIMHAAMTIVGLHYTFCCPLWRGNAVVGSLAFHTGQPLNAAQRHTCEAFARQAALTLENADLLREAELARAKAEAAEQMLRKLMASERERARLEGVLLAARTAQHELNNSLQGISGYCEMLAEEPRMPVPAHALIDEIRAAAHEAAVTVDKLRRITRVEEVHVGGPGPVLDLQRSIR